LQLLVVKRQWIQSKCIQRQQRFVCVVAELSLRNGNVHFRRNILVTSIKRLCGRKPGSTDNHARTGWYDDGNMLQLLFVIIRIQWKQHIERIVDRFGFERNVKFHFQRLGWLQCIARVDRVKWIYNIIRFAW
jgi:hypothetical protein